MKPALVLLPGMDGTGRLFEPFIDAIRNDAEALVVSYSKAMVGYAELTAYVRERLPTDRPFVLLGESFSGPIAISIAASKPAGLVGLVLCCTFSRCPVPYVSRFGPLAALAPMAAMPQRIISALLLGNFATAELRARLRSALAQVEPSTVRRRLQAVLAVDVSHRLQDIEVPVLYLQASRDRVVPPSAGRHIGQGLADLKIAALDAPHFLLQARPHEAAAAIRSFVGELSCELAEPPGG